MTGIDSATANRRGAFALLAVSLLATSPAAAQVANVRGEWTQFVGAAVAGTGDGAPRYGGRLDGYLLIDGKRSGLWDGLTIRLHGEFVYGKSVNRIGSRLLLPVNTALNFPSNDAQDFDLSYSIVQTFGRNRLQLGKINLLDQSAALPIVDGGGKEGFQHLGLAAPPALLASAKVYGAILTVPMRRVTFNFGVWTPEDYTNRVVPDGMFSNGVNLIMIATVPVRPGGLKGFQNLTVYATSKKRRLLTDSPDINPPPEIAGLPQPEPGGFHLRYGFQQFLWQDPRDPARGWGMFGHVGISTGMPELLDWTMTLGLSGSPPIASRPRDRFGLGYFRVSLTSRIVDGLAPLVALEDEQGIEAFYTAEIAHSIRLTATGQVVDSLLRNGKTAAFLGVRAHASF